MGTATDIAIKAIKPVPANNGTAPKAFPNSFDCSAVSY